MPKTPECTLERLNATLQGWLRALANGTDADAREPAEAPHSTFVASTGTAVVTEGGAAQEAATKEPHEYAADPSGFPGDTRTAETDCPRARIALAVIDGFMRRGSKYFPSCQTGLCRNVPHELRESCDRIISPEKGGGMYARHRWPAFRIAAACLTPARPCRLHPC